MMEPRIELQIEWECEKCGKRQMTAQGLHELHYCSHEKIIIDTHVPCINCDHFQEIHLGRYNKG